MDRVKAYRLVWPAIIATGPFVTGQVIFGLVSFAGLSVEIKVAGFAQGVFSGLVPADQLMVGAYVTAAACGVMAMMAAGLLYSVTNVSLWQYGRINWFGLCLIGSLLPFINVFPWVWLFVARVTLRRS